MCSRSFFTAELPDVMSPANGPSPAPRPASSVHKGFGHATARVAAGQDKSDRRELPGQHAGTVG
ncbi:hypothetical protein ACIQGT_25780 [Streptomyces sp. NPDC093108]|uniref:hypothetical protein n=1 Tax=Streptomyces sp. NPDC093108 TaxID=3366030 RepID=UPI0038271CEF